MSSGLMGLLHCFVCRLKRVQEVRCNSYIRPEGERIINISSIEKEGRLPSRSRFSSMLGMNTLASKGPRGDHIAKTSVCSQRAPLNWNSCPLVAMLRRSTRSVLVRFKSLNSKFLPQCYIYSKQTRILAKNGWLLPICEMVFLL